MENYSFSVETSLKIKERNGILRSAILWKRTSVPLIYASMGLSYLFDKKMLNKEDIDALILVTQTP